MDNITKNRLIPLFLMISIVIFCHSCENPEKPNQEEPPKEEQPDPGIKEKIVFFDSFDEVGNWKLESENGNDDWTQGNYAFAKIENGLLRLVASSTCGTPLAKASCVISKNTIYDSLKWEILFKEANTYATANISFNFWVNKKCLTISGFGCLEKPTTLKINYVNDIWTVTNYDSIFYWPTIYQTYEDSIVTKVSFIANGASIDCIGYAGISIEEIKVYY